MRCVWKTVLRRSALAGAVLVATVVPFVAGGDALHGQQGSGGLSWSGVSWPEDGRMHWGGTTWAGDMSALRYLPADGLDLAARRALLTRLRDMAGGRLYVEVTGAVPAEVIIERRPRRDVYLRITRTPDNGHSRGAVRVRPSGDDEVAVIFVANNTQDRLVIESPEWLQWMTVVVNGVVLHDAARPGSE